jgi:hypothetical protein
LRCRRLSLLVVHVPVQGVEKRVNVVGPGLGLVEVGILPDVISSVLPKVPDELLKIARDFGGEVTLAGGGRRGSSGSTMGKLGQVALLGVEAVLAKS